LERIPAAQRGYNSGSIAICLSGRKDFQKIQFKNLKRLIKDIEKAQRKKLKIRLHNEVNKDKTCPNFGLKEVGL
jgi:N-acetyl-anhydromuramyl-L-alanine amidase AmpD